jgi:hypothetical protein
MFSDEALKIGHQTVLRFCAVETMATGVVGHRSPRAQNPI